MFKRALVTLGLVLGLVAGGQTPAFAAYTYGGTAPSSLRDHDAAGVWVPSNLDFKSGWDSTANAAYMIFGFTWYGGELVDYRQAFEIDAEIPCSWAKAAYSLGQGYRAAAFDTDVPNAALPYEDTIFAEPCDDGNLDQGDKGSFGVGVMNVSALVPGTHYFIRVGLSNAWPLTPAPTSPVKATLKVDAGIVYDSTLNVPSEFSSDCSFTDAEIADWRSTAAAGLTRRLQASWCVFSDWKHTVSKDDSSGTLWTDDAVRVVYPQKLTNSSFESGTSSWTLWGYGDQNWATYCPYPGWPSYSGSCFVSFTGVWADLYQTMPQTFAPDTQATVEAAMRCGSPSGCRFQFQMEGTGGGTAESDWSPEMTLAYSTQWYLCRWDYTTPERPSGTTRPYMDSGHTTMWFEIRNAAGTELHVDHTFFGRKTTWADPEAAAISPGVGQASKGITCTPQ